jgi:cytochrome b561
MRAHTVHCGGFALLATIGGIGLMTPGTSDSHVVSAGELRPVFALLLFASVFARGLWGLRSPAWASTDARQDFANRTARMIHLLLYCLVGFQLLLNMGTAGPAHAEDCQYYVACGIIALLLVRVTSRLQPAPIR